MHPAFRNRPPQDRIVTSQRVTSADDSSFPPSALLVALVSCAALDIAAARLPGLWIAAGLITLSLVVRWRIRSDFLIWLAGLAMAACFVALTPDPPDTAALQIGPARARNIFGQTMAAGMVSTAWYVGRGGKSARLLAFLAFASLLFLTACNTYDSIALRVLAVPFTAAVLATTRAVRVRPRPTSRSAGVLAVAFAATLGTAGSLMALVEGNKSRIAAWANPLPAMSPWEGMPEFLGSPVLGPRFADRGDNRRMLRVAGGDGGLLRGVAFDTYDNGRWGPGPDQRLLKSFDATVSEWRGNRHPNDTEVRVDRLNPDNPLIHLPFSATDVDFGPDPGVEWLPGAGPILASRKTPASFTLFDSGVDGHGLAGGVPDATTLERMSALPKGIAGTLRRTARTLTDPRGDDVKTVSAVVAFLVSEHSYSLTFLPGEGDPVGWFLETPGANAHCEVFASSAALLLRAAGIPTRYVVGYLAHERDRRGNWVVRGRDAHAWVEAWCDGNRWVSVEATPGAGLPGNDTERPPAWQRFYEDFLDTLGIWRDRLQDSPLGIMAVAMFVGTVLLVVAWARRRTPTGPEPYPGTATDSRIARRIESILRRRNCPPRESEPWGETCARLPGDDPVKEPLLRLVEMLERRRFGGVQVQGQLEAAWRELVEIDRRLSRPNGSRTSWQDGGFGNVDQPDRD